MSFFISEAFADAATNAAQVPRSEGPFSLFMIIGIFVLFYFMLIRPQNKRAKEQRELVSQIKTGDEVITAGGFLGKVVSTSEQYLKIALTDGVEVNLQRSAISSVLPKGTLKSL